MIYIKKVTNIKPEEERNTYPYSVPSIRALTEFTFNKPVTFVIGENGIGKSTLVESIAVSAGINYFMNHHQKMLTELGFEL